MWLRVVSGADAGRTVEIPAEQGRSFVLGRVRGCDLVIRDEGASRHHAELRTEPAGGLRVRDLGSANGTFVDGQRIKEAMLSGGEELRIGDVEIAVMAHAPEKPGSGGDAPTWSVVSRLVDHRTRGARRATWVALGAAGLALAAVALVLVVGGGDDDRSVPQVVRQLAPSTVLVEALRGDRRTATGTGWVLDAGDGLVATAAHVVNEGVRYRVAIDGQARPAELVGSAPCEDLALLRVQGGVAGLRSARLGKSADLEQGETVVALGYPAGAAATDEVTSTRGVVSSARAAFRDPSPDVPLYREAVQTDTALNPGFSGGPLADLDGRIVGVNAAARTTGSDGRPLQGQNYAIGIDRARRVLGRAAARELGRLDRRDVRLSDDGGAARAPASARALSHRRGAGHAGRARRPGRPRRGAGRARRPPARALAVLLLRGRRGPAGRAGAQAHARTARRRQAARGHGGAGVSAGAVAVVLAGGLSRRMGVPKALVELGGRPLLAWPLAAALDAGLEAVVVAKRGSPLPPLDVPVWPEPAHPVHPLAGVIAALERAAPRAVVVLACDMPFVPAELIARLAALDAVAAAPPGEAFPARYEPAALPVAPRRPRARGPAARGAGGAAAGGGRPPRTRTRCSASTTRRR